jgi:tRNA(His) guanylyltransferase
MKKDSLGDRMKRYENVTRNYLQPRTYTIIRIDGKAFHTFTKGLNKPFDDNLGEAMVGAMGELFAKIQGVKYAYTQSDEISLVLTDFDTFETQSWFGGNVQKMVSVSASHATVGFSKVWLYKEFMKNLSAVNYSQLKWAEFDSRVFQLPNRDEVINYLIWRQQDAVRNSISGLAQSLYSAKKLHGKNQSDMQEMCFLAGHNWNDVPTKYKRGIGFYKWVDDIGEDMVREVSQPDYEIPIFSQNREYLQNLIPDYI